MSSWLFYAILSPVVFAAINFVDKYLLESRVKNYLGMPIYSSIAGLLFGTMAWVYLGFPLLNIIDGILVLVTGVLSIIALVVYFQALSDEETSSVIILFQLTPVFSMVLSFLFLGEVITLKQFLGFTLIILAAIGASLKLKNNKFEISKAFWLIFACDIIWALTNVIFKFVSEENSFGSLLVYEGWGFGLGGIILWQLFPKIKAAFLENFHESGLFVSFIIFINEALYVIARLVTYYAITLGSVTLVSVIGSTQVFFGVIYGIILSIFLPKIFSEDVKISSIGKKLLLAVLAFFGIYIIGS